MDAVLYKAVVVGNSSILEKSSTGIPYFCGRTVGVNDNIIHIAVRHDHCTFVEEALRRFPELLCQKNSYNETPFHVAAKTGNTKILDVKLKSCKVEGVDIAVEATSHPPWRAKNSEGDTPLHVALIYSKIQLATALVEEDPELALFLNNSGETPLHLAIKHHVDASGPGATFVMRCPPKEADPLPVIKLLLDVNKGAACARDANGLTPLLRAASLDSPYISAIKTILDYCPESINVYDSSGKTMLHLLNELPKSTSHADLLRIPELYGLKDYQDSQGNTPAHIAVKNRNIFVVQLLLRMSANFAIKNKEGVSAAYLIQRQIGDFNDLIIAKAEQLQIPYSTSQEEMRIVRLHARLTLAPDDIMSLSERINHIPEPEHGYLQHWLLVACYYSLRKRNALTNCMKDVFDNYFSIHGAKTLSGNPLHAMVRWIPEAIDHSMLELFEDHFKAIVEEAENPEPYSPPWMMKDKHGNTPLHLALLQAARCSVTDYEKSTMVKCIVEFLKFDARSLGCQNNKKETPLHSVVSR
ncbi:hypothetical protein Cgig2_005431 [Carnegiea gigantea]|uniref:Uncharacterized protein n=1 Tax=Carnegiea gigantea TaxID=171969 RepID=A0A9Q1QHM4_9CARY|nr:hypothetical protein Cgig2_005431 [Carnegiea gigantea]